MKHREFIECLDERLVEEAIRRAEAGTSAEVRVFVARCRLHGVEAAARARCEFERLRMCRTAGRNGVLVYVVPEDRAFAVVGDEAIHACCGQAFWDETAAAMEELFRAGKFTEGLVAGLGRAGDVLAARLPRGDDDINELPDAIARD